MNASITRQPMLRVNLGNSADGPGAVSIRCLDPDLLAFLGRSGQLDDDLRMLFRVTVAHAPSWEGVDLPTVSGRFVLRGDEVHFLPHFSFERGLTYRFRFDPQSARTLHATEPFDLEFALPPEQEKQAPPEVTHIYPSGDRLPENLLRFYVCFSSPMQRGRVLKEISLLDADGRPVADALYRPPVELWDRSMSCLTVLLDPGRLKRWVGPNVQLGPPLRADRRYMLEIGPGMTDDHGCPLSEPFRKHFSVGDPVRKRVSVESWTVRPPETGSRQSLVLMFAAPLDWALLHWTIKVVSADGSVIDGKVSVDQGERRWSFTPVRLWTAGAYRIGIDLGLEDVCGNNLSGAFDRAIRRESDAATGANRSSLGFELK